jgi:hypothetical protein
MGRLTRGLISAVIPDDAKRRSQMRDCASGNLEIPGSRFARPGMTAMGMSRYD